MVADEVTVSDVERLVTRFNSIALQYKDDSYNFNLKITKEDFDKLRLENYDTKRPLTRKEIAVLINYFLNPMENNPKTLEGEVLIYSPI